MFIKSFREISKNDAASAGGKGASLGEMTQAGIPVPPGFVILAGAFEWFLEETDLNVEIESILHRVNHKKIHTVENASEEIKALILEAKMPKDIAMDIKKSFVKLKARFVAVRSSATAEDSSTAAWAGQLESYLNTTEKDLLKNVQKCWASLFTPRAIFYRFEKGLHKQKISVAVVVQKMVQSEVSGVAFSVHPVTQDRNQLIIEAGYGLGEAIVSGQITPDSYVVGKNKWKILDKNVSNQSRAIIRSVDDNIWQELGSHGERQKLPDKGITELAKLVTRIEKHYGFPVDVEWALEKKKFYITQSRPITTLLDEEKDFSVKDGRVADEDFPPIKIKDAYEVQGQWIIPLLAWSFWIPWAYAKKAKNLGFKRNNSQYLMIDHRSFHERDGLSQEIRDRTYAELSRGRAVTAIKLFKYLKNIESQIVGIAQKLGNKSQSLQLLKKALLLHAEGAFLVMVVDMMDGATERVIIERIEKENLDQAAVYSHIADRKTATHFDLDRLRQFQKELLENNFTAGVTLEEIETKRSALAAKLRRYQKETEYLGTHNCQGEGRMMERLLTSIFDTPPAFVVTPTPTKISRTLKTALMVAERCIYWRTQMGEQFSRMMYAARPLLANFASQFGMNYDEVMHATFEEIVSAIDRSTPFDKNKVLSRVGKKVAMAVSNEGRVVIASGPFIESLEKRFGIQVRSKTTITQVIGKAAFKGKIRGKVAVVMKSTEGDKVKEGMILVAPETTPDFIFAMNKAAAFVTDRGGITSHAAIIAREMHKPCLVGTKNGTKTLKDGDLVEVDANKGIVKILKRK